MQEDIILRKEVFQVLFRPNIKSASSFLQIADAFEDQYEEWSRNDNQSYTLYSSSKLTALNLNMGSITFISEGDSETTISNPDPAKVMESFKTYISAFGVEEIRRIGFGSISVYNIETTFDDLVEQIYDKTYTTNQEVRDVISDDNPSDVAFFLNGSKNGYTNHIELGPTKKDEALNRFASSFTMPKKRFQGLGDTSFFAATDVFILNPDASDIQADLVTGMIEENKRIEDSYINIVFENQE